jgi:hypothetical protein
LEHVWSELRRRRRHHLAAVAPHQGSPNEEQRVALAVGLKLEVGGVMVLAVRAGRVAAIPHLAGALAPRGGRAFSLRESTPPLSRMGLPARRGRLGSWGTSGSSFTLTTFLLGTI